MLFLYIYYTNYASCSTSISRVIPLDATNIILPILIYVDLLIVHDIETLPEPPEDGDNPIQVGLDCIDHVVLVEIVK